MNYILFDDPIIKKNLLPLTYFRPISEIRCGIMNLKEKWEFLLKSAVSYKADAYLQEKFPLEITEDNLFINAAVLPDDNIVATILSLKNNQKLIFQNMVLAARSSHSDFLDDKNTYEEIIYASNVMKIQYLSDIFINNSKQIVLDYERLTYEKESQLLSKTNTIIGDFPVFLEKGAQAEASIFNTEDGPIYLGKNVKILEGSMIRGPFAALDNSVVKMGAKIYGGTTLGPSTRVGGEIKEVVFLGNSNKGHDGYLGDSVVGEWCNFGAGTNNSNLKNNYSNVKLWNYNAKDFQDTGIQFCGLIMGDHSKSGIASMFNTGTVVGVCSNVFGADYQPKFFPSFKWGGKFLVDYHYDKALSLAKIVAQRRNIQFTALDERLFKSVFDLVQKIEKNS